MHISVNPIVHFKEKSHMTSKVRLVSLARYQLPASACTNLETLTTNSSSKVIVFSSTNRKIDSLFPVEWL